MNMSLVRSTRGDSNAHTHTSTHTHTQTLTHAYSHLTSLTEEIEMVDGWFYGRKNQKKGSPLGAVVPIVEWPEDTVKHQWGSYGQPLCNSCKKYCLDHRYSNIL